MMRTNKATAAEVAALTRIRKRALRMAELDLLRNLAIVDYELQEYWEAQAEELAGIYKLIQDRSEELISEKLGRR